MNLLLPDGTRLGGPQKGAMGGPRIGFGIHHTNLRQFLLLFAANLALSLHGEKHRGAVSAATNWQNFSRFPVKVWIIRLQRPTAFREHPRAPRSSVAASVTVTPLPPDTQRNKMQQPKMAIPRLYQGFHRFYRRFD